MHVQGQDIPVAAGTAVAESIKNVAAKVVINGAIILVKNLAHLLINILVPEQGIMEVQVHPAMENTPLARVLPAMNGKTEAAGKKRF